ncbi:MAG: HD domain-containing protein [Clostridia bacterium]|nr:HD domain-containing protein [Clostridia bacterium]
MEKVNNILKNHRYWEYLQKNEQYERDRKFCKHGIDHHLNVARIAYILSIENNMQIDKEIIYAAGLLHDIGRWKEYEQDVDHASASAELSEDILKECGFNRDQRHMIEKAIKEHRKDGVQNTYLSVLLCRSDKFARNCIDCQAINECNRFKDKDISDYRLVY